VGHFLIGWAKATHIFRFALPRFGRQSRRMAWKRLGVGLLCLAAWTVNFAGSKPPQVILRVYIQTDAQQSGSQRTLPVQLTDPDQLIYINAIPEATERDLVGIDVEQGEHGQIGALLHFNAHAALALDTSTMQADGKILVVMLDGRIIYTPMIDTTVKRGELLVPRGFTQQEIGLLAALAKENLKSHPNTAQ
jgi:hypothetical protein